MTPGYHLLAGLCLRVRVDEVETLLRPALLECVVHFNDAVWDMAPPPLPTPPNPPLPSHVIAY